MTPIPREHGAWGMLLQPFAAAVIVSREWNWLVVAALASVLLSFLIREPLLILARQRWIWRDPHPETSEARRSLLWLTPALGALGVVLLWRLPPVPVLMLTGVAISMTVLAVWAAIRNKQRAIWVQVLGAFALSTTALFAALAATGSIPLWSLWVWFLLSLHSAAAIFVVHARLAARMAAKKPAGSPGAATRDAARMQVGQLALAAVVAAIAGGAMALPIAVSGVLLLIEALRLRRPEVLDEPLRRVGFRMLTIALLHTALTIAVLWKGA
ncbi:MAG: YwiC-like family protein [Bryobacteraceae bacterium]